MTHHPGAINILSVTMEAEEAMARYSAVMAGTAIGQVKLTTGGNVQTFGIAQRKIETADVTAGGGKALVDVRLLGISKYIRSASTCTAHTWLEAEGADGHLLTATLTGAATTHNLVGLSLTTPDTDGDYGYVFLNLHHAMGAA